MKPELIERVFGRERLKMATGEHVEVFREAVASGERRRYTKRFLNTGNADFRQWTEREWRILARLIGHGIRCVPDVVQFDGGAEGGLRQVQTYDAGVTVDQWATLLPVTRNGVRRGHVFEDCAHWWALAHHCLIALDEIHALQLVHLDLKADNLCIPYGPATFDPAAPNATLHIAFDRLALIDFAFSLVSRERLATALPIGWQKDYDYQSPRLLRALEAGRAGDLRPTQDLDWRCDFYSLAAMLRRYLPDDEWARGQGAQAGWTARRYDDARALIYGLRDCHDRDAAQWRPHRELIEATGAQLAAPDLAQSLASGWSLARDPEAAGATALVTPLTRIALARATPTAVTFVPRPIVAPPPTPAVVRRRPAATPLVIVDKDDRVVAPAASRARVSRWAIAASIVAAVTALAMPSFVGDAPPPSTLARGAPEPAVASAAAPAVEKTAESPAPPADKPVERREPPADKPIERREPPAERAEPVVPPRPSEPARATPPVVASDKPARPPAASQRTARAPAQQRQHIASAPAIARAPRGAPPLQLAKAAPVSPPSQAPIVAAVVPEADKADASTAAVAAPTTEVDSAPPARNEIAPAPAERPPAVVAVEPPRVVSPAPSDKPRTSKHDVFRAALHDVLKLFGAVEQRAAPVDERSAQAPRPPRPARAPDPLPRPSEREAPPPSLVARAAPPVAQPQPSTVTAPVPRPPDAMPVRAPAVDAWDNDLAVQGRRMLADTVPRIAAQARSDATRVLWTAAVADNPGQDRTVADATYVPWRSERTYVLPSTATTRARQLHDDSRRAFTNGRDSEAIDLGVRAFAADPRDPDIAGFLGYLHLRTTQAETARQLALYALAVSGQSRSERIDDWATLAIASALTGREVDAGQAFLVELALSRDVERSCRDALRAYETYGERLRAPVETLLRRVHAQQRGFLTPACAWPAYRMATR